MEQAAIIGSLAPAAIGLGRELARLVAEDTLSQRAAETRPWGCCPECGKSLQSKGRRPRQLTTSVGVLKWSRAVGWCPAGCRIGQIVPLDDDLGLESGQRSNCELISLGCSLAVNVPFATTGQILERAVGETLAASTIWSWVRGVGARALQALEAEIKAMETGDGPAVEVLEIRSRQLVMAIGADGVMVPFRPNPGSPKGPAQWREVKIAVLARLGRRISRCGETASQLLERRLVAVLGDIDALAARLRLEAHRQGVFAAERVVWISDGTRGLWRLFAEVLPKHATGILGFYHAAGQLWQAGEAWFGYRPSTEIWFRDVRSRLRQGKVDEIIAELDAESRKTHRHIDRRAVIERVRDYLSNHRQHLDFPAFKAAELPLGSGFVESACKWLIQQRFKGVGMRWSEDGFSHLLLLRLAWANGRIDDLFQPLPLGSPNS
ncbi:MAG: ISKra4 family transposase [Anaerolineae bacterium]